MVKKRKQIRQNGKPRVFSYLRFSSPDQASGDSWRRQDRDRQDWCERHKMTLDESLTFEDPGISAYRGRHRSGSMKGEGGFADFLAAIKAGLVPPGSVLLVERLDRLTREKPMEAVPTLLAIIAAGITIVTLKPTERVYDEATCNEWGMIELVVSVKLANQESEQKSTRIKSAWNDRRKDATAGKANMTRTCPAWLRPTGEKGFEEVEEKSRWVKLAYKLAIEGHGIGRITKRLNRETEGVCISRRKRRLGGTKWHTSYVAKLLKARTVLGEYQPHEDREEEVEVEGGKKETHLVRVPVGPVLKGYYPVIVSEEDYAKAQLALADRKVGSSGPNNVRVRNLFGSLLTCARTGERATISDKGKGGVQDLRLMTGLGSTASQPFEDAVLRLFSSELKLADQDEGEAVREAEDLQARIESLKDYIEATMKRLDGRPDSLLWDHVDEKDRERADLIKQLGEVKRRIASRPAQDMDRLREALRLLATASEEERVEARLRVRARLKRIVERIYVVILRRPSWLNYRLHWHNSVKAEVVLRDGSKYGVVVMPGQMAKGMPINDRDLRPASKDYGHALDGEYVQLLDGDGVAAFRYPVEEEDEELHLSGYAGRVDPSTLLGVLDEWASGDDAVEAAREDHERAMRADKQGGKANIVLVVDGVERKIDALGMNLGDVLESLDIDADTVKIRGVAGARMNFVPRDGQKFTITSK